MDVLRRYPVFRRLWLARVVSFLGDSLGLVALIIYVTEETDSGAALGLLLLAGDFTPALLSPVLGAIADRTEGRVTMVTCELGQATAIGLIVVLQPPLAVVLVLVAARSLLAATFQAASRSAVADLVADEDLEVANTAIGFGTHGLDALGPLLAAGLLLALDPRQVLVIDVLTFVVSALLLVRLPRVEIDVDEEGLFTGVRRGLGATRRHRPVWILALVFWGIATFGAADDVAIPFLATDELGGGDVAIAALFAGGGIGLLVGFAALGRRRPPAMTIALIGMAVGSLGNLLSGLAPVLALAVALQAVRGFGNAWHGVGVDTVIQREVPARERGRVFANVYGGVGLAAGVSYVAGGALVDALGPRVVLVVGAGAGLCCAAIGAWASRSPTTPMSASPMAPSP